MAKKKESTPGENLAKQIIEQYNPKSVADMQNAFIVRSLLFAGTIILINSKKALLTFAVGNAFFAFI